MPDWPGSWKTVGLRAASGLALAAALAVCTPMAGAVGAAVGQLARRPAAAIASGGMVPGGGTWGAAQVVRGWAGFAEFGSEITSVSCGSVGNCLAGGDYGTNVGGTDAFVVGEINGIWGSAEAVPGLAALDIRNNARITSVSCSSAGDCSAGGYYTDASSSTQAFVVSEVNGSWGTAQEVPGLAALNVNGEAKIGAVSCTPGGNCGAGGYYTDASGTMQAFVVSEASGTWSTAEAVSGMAVPSGVTSVSCTSGANCSAVAGPYIITETSGTWGDAFSAPVGSSLLDGGLGTLTSISCTSAVDCSAVGYYADPSTSIDEAIVLDESNGTWGSIEKAPGTANLTSGDSQLASVSCASPGNCSAGGYYAGNYGVGNNGTQPFVINENNGTWATAEELPGSAALSGVTLSGGITAVSCPSAGNCGAVGYLLGDQAGVGLAFVSSESNGTWGQARQLADPASAFNGDELVSVACASAGLCSAGGMSGDARAIVVNESTATATSLAVSTSSIQFGDEQGLRLSVSVASRAGGTPGGVVTVTAAKAKVCVITLVSATGGCALRARELAPGTYRLAASYSGSADFLGSASAAKTVTVSRAASATRLVLSSTKVTYRHETAEHITVTVTSPYGVTPDGRVTVKADSATICVAVLKSGKVNCTMTATRLKVGTYELVADYGGSADNSPSTSARKTLKIVR